MKQAGNGKSDNAVGFGQQPGFLPFHRPGSRTPGIKTANSPKWPNRVGPRQSRCAHAHARAAAANPNALSDLARTYGRQLDRRGAEAKQVSPLPAKMGGGGNDRAISAKAPLSGNPYNGAKGGHIKSASAGRFRCSFGGCIHAIDGLRCAYGAVQKACSGRPWPAPGAPKELPLPPKMGGGGNDCAISAKAPLPGNPYNGAFACGICP